MHWVRPFNSQHETYINENMTTIRRVTIPQICTGR